MSNSTREAHREATHIAMFGAGCFWGVQFAFDQIEGVVETAVGYAGGETAEPSYREVCGKDTGHAEVVWLRFDPEVVSYRALCDAFFSMHDPTQKDRQGPDVGRQYRSIVFCADSNQRDVVEAAMKDAQAELSRPIATELAEWSRFWRAEEGHQKYFEQHGITACGM